MTRECMHERVPMKVVILRESGVSSTLRLIDFIAGVSGILGPTLSRGRRLECMTSRHCEPTGRANARPMTGSAKQSMGLQ